jgi:sec-independent protein translocase protein TatA
VVGDLLQPTHLLFILVVALLVLGPKRLPEVGRALGRGLRDFRTAISGEETPEQTIPSASATTSEHSSPTGAHESAPTEVQAPQDSAEPVTASTSTEAET